MAIKWFHSRSAEKRRGDSLPARLRFAARRGTTLVELLIAMLILSLVCVAWLEIIGIQSARKEARRREAVERLAGMMDAFMQVCKTGINETSGSRVKAGCCYRCEMSPSLKFTDKNVSATDVLPMFEGKEPNLSVGYQLCVVAVNDLPTATRFKNWGSSQLWLVGKLYDQTGTLSSTWKPPFFYLSACLGFLP